MHLPAARLAADAVARETTVSGLLRATCAQLTGLLEAEGCTIARAVGDVLINVADHGRSGRTFRLGRSFLVPDYPLTQEVLERRVARSVALVDPHADPSEAALLRELGIDALLMLPLVVEHEAWGLVEIFDAGTRRFDDGDVARAGEVVTRAGAVLAERQRLNALPELLR